MRRILAVTAAAALALGLAACGEDTTDTTPPPTTTTTGTTPGTGTPSMDMSSMPSTEVPSTGASSTGASSPSTPSSGSSTGSTAAIEMKTIQFVPATQAVKVGTTVTWTNNDIVTHTVTSGKRGAADAGSLFDQEVKPGETFSHTFTEAGSFEYFCRPHPNMNATVTVS